jgi:hypothetical protein
MLFVGIGEDLAEVADADKRLAIGNGFTGMIFETCGMAHGNNWLENGVVWKK